MGMVWHWSFWADQMPFIFHISSGAKIHQDCNNYALRKNKLACLSLLPRIHRVGILYLNAAHCWECLISFWYLSFMLHDVFVPQYFVCFLFLVHTVHFLSASKPQTEAQTKKAFHLLSLRVGVYTNTSILEKQKFNLCWIHKLGHLFVCNITWLSDSCTEFLDPV